MYLHPDLHAALADQLLDDRRRVAANRRIARATGWRRHQRAEPNGRPDLDAEPRTPPSEFVHIVAELGAIADGHTFSSGGPDEVALRRLVLDLRDVAARSRVDVGFARAIEGDPAVVLIRVAARLASRARRDGVLVGTMEGRRLRRQLATLRRTVLTGPAPVGLVADADVVAEGSDHSGVERDAA